MSLSITLIIIIVTVIVSLMANNNPELYAKLLFNPYQAFHRKEWHRVITHGFVHDRNSLMHLIFNMFVLHSFGSLVEDLLIYKLGTLGILFYLLLYFGGMIVATIPSLVKHRDNYNYNSVGASGAVSAVLFASIAFLPFVDGGGINIMFIPIDIPPLIFGVLYIIYEMYMQKRGGTNIAHDAHIWGALFGFTLTILFVPNTLANFITIILNVF